MSEREDGSSLDTLERMTVSSTAMTWAPERRQRWVDPGKHGEGEQRRRERKSWMEELERGVHSTANRAC